MPFVTEHIYSMLPLKDSESIMVSEYPKYEKDYVYSDDTLLVDKILNDIVSIRNIKADNKITKDAFVKIDKVVNDEALAIYKTQLKINDDIIIKKANEELKNITYESDNIKITYYYEGNKEDESKKEEEIEKLKSSIARREKLLSNEAYVNKAPKNIVDMDRQKLVEEKKKLELLQK